MNLVKNRKKYSTYTESVNLHIVSKDGSRSELPRELAIYMKCSDYIAKINDSVST